MLSAIHVTDLKKKTVDFVSIFFFKKKKCVNALDVLNTFLFIFLNSDFIFISGLFV